MAIALAARLPTGWLRCRLVQRPIAWDLTFRCQQLLAQPLRAHERSDTSWRGFWMPGSKVPCRAFARRNMRPQPVPLVVSVEDAGQVLFKPF